MESQAMHNIFAIVIWAFAIICLVGVLFAWSGWMVKRHTRRMDRELESLGLNRDSNPERLITSAGTSPTNTGPVSVMNRMSAGGTTEQIKPDNKRILQEQRQRQGLKSGKIKNSQREIKGGKRKTDFLLVATF
jgi:hypothetical protein